MKRGLSIIYPDSDFNFVITVQSPFLCVTCTILRPIYMRQYIIMNPCIHWFFYVPPNSNWPFGNFMRVVCISILNPLRQDLEVFLSTSWRLRSWCNPGIYRLLGQINKKLQDMILKCFHILIQICFNKWKQRWLTTCSIPPPVQYLSKFWVSRYIEKSMSAWLHDDILTRIDRP